MTSAEGPRVRATAEEVRDCLIGAIEDLHTRHRHSFEVLWPHCAAEQCRRARKAVTELDAALLDASEPQGPLTLTDPLRDAIAQAIGALRDTSYATVERRHGAADGLATLMFKDLVASPLERAALDPALMPAAFEQMHGDQQRLATAHARIAHLDREAVERARAPQGERLVQLARHGARIAHGWFFDAAENMDNEPTQGHEEPFGTCPHPDCAMVRPEPPPVDAAAPPPDKESD